MIQRTAQLQQGEPVSIQIVCELRSIVAFVFLVLEQLFPHGPDDMDLIFSVQYSQSDGFANARYDNDDPSVNQNTILKGFKGPDHVWKNMLCAFQLGVPSDPDYFQKHFGLRQSVTSSSGVPYPLSEDQRRFAQLEFIAMAANMIKETGAMGQAVSTWSFIENMNGNVPDVLGVL